MTLLLRATLGACLVLLCPFLHAQDPPFTFKLAHTRLSESEVLLTFATQLPPGVQLYSIDKKGEDAPFSAINFDSAAVPYLKGAPAEKGATKLQRDPVLETDVRYLTGSVTWQQVARIPATDSVVLKGTIGYMYKKGEEYLPAEQAFRFFVDRQKEAPGAEPVQGAPSSIAARSLLWIFLTAFGGGLLALLTPCV